MALSAESGWLGSATCVSELFFASHSPYIRELYRSWSTILTQEAVQNLGRLVALGGEREALHERGRALLRTRGALLRIS
jgi:hypothetical protein